jgi:SAM-dependent methyltransferase
MSANLSTKPWWLACWSQWFAERALRQRGVTFRSSSADVVEAGYEAMDTDEFDAVNGRQEWANWRILPSLLKGRLPDRPLSVLDLGCGTGASTQALAACCPGGSQILAFERSARFLKRARARDYRLRGGQTAMVELRQQSIADAWRNGRGARLLDGEIDLVVSCGVLGHHFNHWTIGPVLGEIQRVLRPGGLACLDAGPSLTPRELVSSMKSIGLRPIAEGRSCLFDRNRQIVFQSEGTGR